MTMRYEWQGRVHYAGQQPSPARNPDSLHTHAYGRDLVNAAFPWHPKEVERRWRLQGKEGTLRFRSNETSAWPENAIDVVQAVGHCLVDDGKAFAEWNIAEEKSGPRLMLHVLPPWSCESTTAKVRQRAADGLWSELSRAFAIRASDELEATIQRERQALLDLDQGHHEAMAVMPARILGASQVNVISVVGEVEVRQWIATRGSGYRPAASSVKLGPAYLATRMVRFATFAKRLREEVLISFHQGLASAFEELGFSPTVDFQEAWAPAEESTLHKMALGTNGDRDHLADVLAHRRDLAAGDASQRNPN